MKYGKGYSMIMDFTGYLGRTVLFFRQTELDYILNLLEDQHNKKILDYGCNTGYIAHKIKCCAPDNKVYGVDINEFAIKRAKAKYKNIEFSVIDDNFIDNNFDVIIISHVLEHIRNRKAFMNNIAKMLSKKGKVIIAVPQERIRGDATPVQLLYNLVTLHFENPHVVKLDYDAIKQLLNEDGLIVEDKLYTNFFYPLKSKSRKIHSGGLVVVASKKNLV